MRWVLEGLMHVVACCAVLLFMYGEWLLLIAVF
jgi:hypothetical protein